jgi:CubicO group peptidase (beta-lactamase class C family)
MSSRGPGALATVEEVGAEAAGIDPYLFGVLAERVRVAVEHGPLPSAQLAVARGGRLAEFRCFGDTRPDLRYVLQSAGRPLLASIMWQLLGSGELRLDERVADIVPEFGTNGKDVITVEQVLLHTAGLPFAPLGYPKMLDHVQRLAAFGRWRLDWEPGSRLQFHLTSAAWIIAELVERRTGLTVAEYLRTRIAEPLGLGLELGVPVDRQAGTVAPMIATDRTSDNQDPDPWGPWYLATPEVLAAGEPSHSLVGTAADVALHYQAVYHSGLWDDRIVADATRIRLTATPHGDQLYGGSATPVNMGLFVTVSGDTGGNLMPTTGSPRTWGHGGAAYQLGFHDPETDVSFACLTNGYPLSGYDYSRGGTAYITNLANLAADLVRLS